jgi:DNA-binding transcriptional LysR family regulator
VESRPLRYFIAVAEELNFARAAGRLGIASPPLSRAIRKLEAELGITLLERSTHHVALTPAGSVLLQQARIALDALDAAGRRAQRAAGGRGAPTGPAGPPPPERMSRVSPCGPRHRESS